MCDHKNYLRKTHRSIHIARVHFTHLQSKNIYNQMIKRKNITFGEKCSICVRQILSISTLSINKKFKKMFDQHSTNFFFILLCSRHSLPFYKSAHNVSHEQRNLDRLIVKHIKASSGIGPRHYNFWILPQILWRVKYFLFISNWNCWNLVEIVNRKKMPLHRVLIPLSNLEAELGSEILYRVFRFIEKCKIYYPVFPL